MRQTGKDGGTAADAEDRKGRAVTVKNIPDYRQYTLSAAEWWQAAGMYVMLDGMVSFLFYRSVVAFFLGLPGMTFFIKRRRQACLLRQRKRLEEEFLMGMQSVSSALSAGYSVENAFSEALVEIRKLYGKEALITREFAHIERMLKLNETLEVLLLDLGERSGAEDIQSLGEIFSAAKRSGGDLNAIIRNTISIMAQKKEVQQEIEVCLSAKKMEQTVMSGIPFFILGYVGLTSPEFLQGLYHTGMGIVVMTAGLGIYIAAFMLGQRIVRIEV